MLQVKGRHQNLMRIQRTVYSLVGALQRSPQHEHAVLVLLQRPGDQVRVLQLVSSETSRRKMRKVVS